MEKKTLEKREHRAETPERIDQGVWYTPLVDIIENNDAFIFQADMPGVKAEDLDINFDNGVLSIDGRIQPREEQREYALQEYGVGHFYRQFTLNTPVDVNQIKAELKNGELTLTVPKAEAAKAKKIEIKTA